MPKISNGTGEDKATAVFELLEEWNSTERINLMSLDTTASNSGINTGATCTSRKKN